jgi:anti-sigma-K factor RskA
METGIHELTAGYALDALDPDERYAYEAHLRGCEQCQRELETFWQTTGDLAVAASGPAPSTALRERILADVRAEPPQNVVVLEPTRSRVVPILAAAAAIAAVVALAVGLWATDVSRQLGDTRSALERAQSTAAVLADPDSRSLAFQTAETGGSLVVSPDGDAVLVVDDLGPAPDGKTYEMWIVSHGDAPQRAGVFPGRDGRDVVPVDGAVGPGQVVLVTVEPEGGVDAPTTDPILGTTPA